MTTTLKIAVAENVDLASYDTIAFGVFTSDAGLEVPGGDGSDAIPSIIDAAFAKRHHFEAKKGQTLVIRQEQEGPTVLAVGCGDGSSQENWRHVGASVVRSSVGRRALLLLPILETPATGVLGEAVTTGALLASYSYSVRSDDPHEGLESLDVGFVNGGENPELLVGVAAGIAVAHAVSFARDMVNEFPSSMTPTKLAEEATTLLSSAQRVTSEVWELERIKDEKLGGLLGVARGSHQDPRLVVATYSPEGTPTHHVVLVGKGVTFDSGGLSLKTAGGMTTMKTDMTGAAVVLGALSACHDLGVRATVTAIAPMTENMPGGQAIKPGDVLIARNGTTIEVLNTDAEGRLILADGLSLAVEMKPDAIIDVATLTGAAVVALGTGVAGLLSNNDELAQSLDEAGKLAGEPLWRLPLVEEYESHIKSEIADIKNIGAPGEAGTISAALFLQRFVDETPWAHLDIAGPARSEKTSGYLVKGGTAFSLRTILSYLRSL